MLILRQLGSDPDLLYGVLSTVALTGAIRSGGDVEPRTPARLWTGYTAGFWLPQRAIR